MNVYYEDNKGTVILLNSHYLQRFNELSCRFWEFKRYLKGCASNILSLIYEGIKKQKLIIRRKLVHYLPAIKQTRIDPSGKCKLKFHSRLIFPLLLFPRLIYFQELIHETAPTLIRIFKTVSNFNEIVYKNNTRRVIFYKRSKKLKLEKRYGIFRTYLT